MNFFTAAKWVTPAVRDAADLRGRICTSRWFMGLAGAGR